LYKYVAENPVAEVREADTYEEAAAQTMKNANKIVF